jgi:RNA polymerase sigma factor (sigma-70 family)
MSVKPSEEQEFAAFVRDRGDALLRFARRLIPDAGDAEDALQTALLRLTAHWPKQYPEAYIRTTLVNIAKDRARRRHLVAVPTDVRAEFIAAGADHADAMDAQARLDAVLAILPPRQRVTVVLRVLEGLNEAETAKAMGCSPGTAKSNLARGLDKVRQLLSDPLTCAEELR